MQFAARIGCEACIVWFPVVGEEFALFEETMSFVAMFPSVDTRIPAAVECEVEKIYREIYPDGDAAFVARAFAWAGQCFNGQHAEYQAIDARYHDFEHTLQGTLCLARLLLGRHLANVEPRMDEHSLQLVLLAILFHDTGYLKKRDDLAGTGAKYTLTHVSRSAEFARGFLREKGWSESDLDGIRHMILCTGVNADLAVIPFGNELERTLGFALATSDLLGQMAAPDYVEKLPVLFLEFAEAARSGGEQASRFAAYKNTSELMRGTPGFWRNYVLPKIERDFLGVHRFLSVPFPSGTNPYLLRVEENIRRLKQMLAA